uniref:Protein smoothened n=1 Tax=Clastoptera arizonana TaxID=38151 RepID=A0A1B6DDX7_9HEMI
MAKTFNYILVILYFTVQTTSTYLSNYNDNSDNNAEHHETPFHSRESFMHRKLEHERSFVLFHQGNNAENSKVAGHCRRPAKCQVLNNSTGFTCLGAKLPYNYTSLDLVPGFSSVEEVQEYLQVFKGLSELPKCWAIMQPFLCSLYLPKCENGTVQLPTQEMCKMVMHSCRIIAIERGWTALLKCDNQTEFPRGCMNDVQLKFSSGRCKEPMVQTDNPISYYDGVEGCGVQCDNPLFTPDERYQIHRFVAWAATTCLVFNLFTVVTFMIDWKSASKYPALVIFYINFCFLIVCVGWLAQFLPGGREDIVCRKDGTLRVGEPSAGENLSCVVVFVLVYYFLMAGIVWFVILTYAWHISFEALVIGKIKERMDKKGAYFHLVAWSLPLVLTITTMALGEIDGNSVSGVCFVGSINHIYRGIFLLLPVFAALCVGGFFLFKGLLTLIRLRISSQEIMSDRDSAKISETILRMGIFSVLIFIFGITIFVCHIHEFRHSALWNHSFRKFIVCRLGVTGTDPSQCRMESRPSLSILQLHLLSLFATGVTMSSWVWTSSTVDIWIRFYRKITNKEIEESIKLKKHKVIAQAYAKRRHLNSDGRLSISIHNTYQDPVGINFELNSQASGELNSSWAAALPKLVKRRGGMVAVTNSSSSQRRNSMDSEISYSVRSLDFRVSVESRRHSLDSAVSVQLSEITKTVRKGTRSRSTARGGRSKRRRRETRNRTTQLISRRGSSTSQDSQLGAKILSALQIGVVDNPPSASVGPNLKRRPGNAGLDDHVNMLAEKIFGNLNIKLPSDSEVSSEDDVNNKENKNVRPNENGSNIKDEEEESDDITAPLTENYKNKVEVDGRASKISNKSKQNGILVSESNRNIRKSYTDDRSSKLSNRSDRSKTSWCSRSSKKKEDNNETKKNIKEDKQNYDETVYQSCSDLENCTDDLKWIHSEGDGKSLCSKVSVGITTDSSFSPELVPLMYQSSSGVSLGGREIGTQTSVSFNNNEHPLNSYGELSIHKKKLIP